ELPLGDEARDVAIEARERAAQRVADPLREQRVDPCGRDAELVARRPERRALAAGAEVGEPLRGCAKAAAARVVEAALELLLERDARERCAVSRIDGHHEPGVRVRRRLPRLAPAPR